MKSSACFNRLKNESNGMRLRAGLKIGAYSNLGQYNTCKFNCEGLYAPGVGYIEVDSNGNQYVANLVECLRVCEDLLSY
jgi:hypothetical protein